MAEVGKRESQGHLEKDCYAHIRFMYDLMVYNLKRFGVNWSSPLVEQYRVLRENTRFKKEIGEAITKYEEVNSRALTKEILPIKEANETVRPMIEEIARTTMVGQNFVREYFKLSAKIVHLGRLFKGEERLAELEDIATIFGDIFEEHLRGRFNITGWHSLTLLCNRYMTEGSIE